MERQQQIIDGLPVHVFDTRAEMGAAAARGAAHIIREAIDKKGEANVVFAAAPSQDDLIASLLGQDIDWRRVRGFHQDEYIGLDPAHSAGFGNFLRRAIFDRVPFGELFYMACPPDEAEAMCEKYTALLEEYPPDLIFWAWEKTAIWLLMTRPWPILTTPDASKWFPSTTCAGCSR